MGKITKKKLEKHFKDVYKKTRKKKTLGKEIEEHVKSIAIKELEAHGDEGMEKIVIDNISIEIWSENPESMVAREQPAILASSAKPAMMASADEALTRCYYYCYVIGGTRICRKICW
jgi:hypothetical protein